jgi:hypothetical protein
MMPTASTTDDYPTDEWIMRHFEDYFDPCPLGGLSDPHVPDGLKISWGIITEHVFINPPYSNPKAWVSKAIVERNSWPNMKIVMLLKHDSSTHWYRMLHEAGAHFLPIQGRLKHGTGQACAFPSVLVFL